MPPPAEIAGVPFFPQEDLQCGPAALATVMGWAGRPVRPDDLVAEAWTPGRAGSLQSDIVSAARRQGLLAVRVDGVETVLAEVAAGHPVLVLQNLAVSWYPLWHYAVAVGFDPGTGTVLLRSGTEERLATGLDAFRATVELADGWALAVLPPDRLPAAAGEAAVLDAAAALERAGHADAAATAYRAMLARWPDSFGAHFGLGNVRFAAGDFAGAAAAFEAATRVRPERPAGWNNLAYALDRLGRRDEARRAAEEAVLLAPPDRQATYRDTLREIAG